MAWNRDTAKQYLGIPEEDTSQDDAIDAAMNYTLAAVEVRLARGLFRERHIVRFLHTKCQVIQLPRPPIVEVFDIVGMGLPQDLLVHHEIGSIEHPMLANQRTVEIDYEGGFSELPLDLERTLWQAFLAYWASLDPTTGGPPADGGEGDQDISRLTVFDAFSINYESSRAMSGTAATLEAEGEHYWGWLAPWSDVLSLYRFGPAGVELGMA